MHGVLYSYWDSVGLARWLPSLYFILTFRHAVVFFSTGHDAHNESQGRGMGFIAYSQSAGTDTPLMQTAATDSGDVECVILSDCTSKEYNLI